MKLRPLAVLFFALFLSAEASAAILIPTGLTATDRIEALKIIGMGTSTKLLSDPYPLGGYDGLELGLSFESLPTDDLGRLGNRLAAPQQDVSYPKLTIGKGLYNNLDMFIQFTPYTRQDELSQFGGIMRWGFYQAQFQPLSASILLHMNNGNVGNALTTRTYGVDLVGGMNVRNVALFGGVGFIESTGTFAGGAAGVTSSGSMESESVTGYHTVYGANIRILEKGFLALQIDRYSVPVFSGKLGVRF
ncbi:MAG: hypothetical protein V4760_06600 [Bdellovibrionota bacterium]